MTTTQFCSCLTDWLLEKDYEIKNLEVDEGEHFLLSLHTLDDEISISGAPLHVLRVDWHKRLLLAYIELPEFIQSEIDFIQEWKKKNITV
jgi:hypothetical protein